MSVFDPNGSANQITNDLFFADEGVTIARYDQLRYPFIDQLTEKQLGFFWRPQEIDLVKDGSDFKSLAPHEQHIFTSNLKRQIVLDSVQGRSPVAAFGPIITSPELETWNVTWAFSETIHSRSYTHIIRNVYPNPSIVFDQILDIEEIVDCAKDISKTYDELISYNHQTANFGYRPDLTVDLTKIPVNDSYHAKVNYILTNPELLSLHEHKRRLWLALMSVNILEGIRFYVSFACSWTFPEQKKGMMGNAKIIKLICRDENLHLAGTQYLLKTLVQDDPEFARIARDTERQCIEMFKSAVDQEKIWAKFLFKDGSMLGLNEQILSEYIEWIANRRLQAVGFQPLYIKRSNPLPWTEKWISGEEIQVAPQEGNKTEYNVGAIKQDVTKDFLSGLSL